MKSLTADQLEKYFDFLHEADYTKNERDIVAMTGPLGVVELLNNLYHFIGYQGPHPLPRSDVYVIGNSETSIENFYSYLNGYDYVALYEKRLQL